MSKLNIFCLIFIAYSGVLFSQVKIEKIQELDIGSIIDKDDLIFNAKQQDSIFLLTIKNDILDSIIRQKINYIRNTFPKGNKNIKISFQSNDSGDYMDITGNIPNNWMLNNNYLEGVININDFHLFIYNYTINPIDNYFCKTTIKILYLSPEPVDEIYLINTPTWIFCYKDNKFMEVASAPPLPRDQCH